MIISPWPVLEKNLLDDEINKEMIILQDVISSIRTIRSRMNIPPSKKIDLVIKCDDDRAEFVHQNSELIIILARLESYSTAVGAQKPPQSATSIVQGMELYIPLGGLVDLDEEKRQLNKRKNKIKSLLLDIEKKLSNKNFVDRAPKDIVKREEDKSNDLKDELVKIDSNLEILI